MNNRVSLLILFPLIVLIATALGAVMALTHVHWVDLTALEQYKPGKPSLLLDDEGIEWGRFELDRRAPIAYQQMPKHLINAFLAAEDREFFSHSGFSMRGIARSVLVNLRRGRKAQGASTITQQLVKLLFFDSKRSFTRKIKEGFMSIALERQFSKEHILKTYLNYVYFGCGIYGVEAAAQRFWGIPASQLSLAQCASLAAIVRSPVNYCPLINQSRNLQRRNLILTMMRDLTWITVDEYNQAATEQLQLKAGTTACAPYVKEAIRQQLEEWYGKHALYQGGLKIQTTINKQMQLHAQERFAKHFVRLRKEIAPDIEGAMMTIDHTNGEIKVLIGGVDFKKSPFNRALQALRQVGSIFKPLVYAQALMNGLDLTDCAVDEPIEIPVSNGSWSPRNHNRRYEGEMTYARALSVSCNTIAVKALQKAGAQQVVSLAQKAGISRAIHPYPSLALGCIDASVKEAVGMFSVFANNGIRNEPYFIKWVKDEWGVKLYQHSSASYQILPRIIAQQIASILRAGINRYANLFAIKEDLKALGKTGTTDDSRTCWFCGSTPRFTSCLYVGCDDNRPLGKIYPSRVVFPLWLECYRKMPYREQEFVVDPSLSLVTIDSFTGQLVTDDTRESISIYC